MRLEGECDLRPRRMSAALLIVKRYDGDAMLEAS
jgi:hypothetical protein